MKFKLDQNMDPQAAVILRNAGHDAITVKEQNLLGARDSLIASICQQEGRCLVTLDTDFRNPFLYPPQKHPGIIVVRHPRPTRQGLLNLISQLCETLERIAPSQQLWILEPGRVRIFAP